MGMNLADFDSELKDNRAMSLTIPVPAIPTADIWQYGPHRPPMVWIDKILSYDEHDGECSLTVQADGLYMGAEGLRPTACIELIAQASGYITICFTVLDRGQTGAIKRAFLAGVKGADLPTTEVLSQVHVGDELRVHIHRSREMGPISVIEGRVMKGDLLVAKAQLKVFKEL
jgi:predicted hotdog family 3-hydroxylacyl-ACP dehydratase